MVSYVVCQLHNDRLPTLVVLSACHSEGVGRGFVEANVAHVLAVTASSPINDGVAIKFMQAFYRDLFVRRLPVTNRRDKEM
jgi:hypothetical protein